MEVVDYLTRAVFFNSERSNTFILFLTILTILFLSLKIKLTLYYLVTKNLFYFISNRLVL